jgi:hypothetical protein
VTERGEKRQLKAEGDEDLVDNDLIAEGCILVDNAAGGGWRAHGRAAHMLAEEVVVGQPDASSGGTLKLFR